VDTPTPAEFDALLTEILPGTTSHRKHWDTGYVDHIDIGLIQLEIEVYTKLHRRKAGIGSQRKNAGDINVEIRGVREVVDGSTTVLWQHKGKGLDGLREALVEAKAQLLGLAAGFLQVCGEPELPGVTPTLGAPPAKDKTGADDDLDDLTDMTPAEMTTADNPEAPDAIDDLLDGLLSDEEFLGS